MIQSGIIALAAFTCVSLLVVAGVSLLGRGNKQARDRLRKETGETRPPSGWGKMGRNLVSRLPSLGLPLLPKQEKERGQLLERLSRGGINHPQAMPLFLGVKACLMLLGPVVVALGFMLGQEVSFTLLGGALATGVGMVLPGLWLDWKTSRRRMVLRRALPDALDMLVMCLEGGLSLNAALQRVRGELQTVHTSLATELTIAEREMMMGLSAAEALRKLGERADLEELRSLSAVLLQSQRYGASVVKAIRIYADTLRVERQQKIEESAQKAAVKILFPTLLCIFPAIFVVILGPAAYQIRSIFNHMR